MTEAEWWVCDRAPGRESEGRVRRRLQDEAGEQPDDEGPDDGA